MTTLEAAVAFDGVLPPESASFVGAGCDFQVPWGYQNTPERLLLPISLSGTVGFAACGETEMVGSLSGRHSVRANCPD